jgi:uncharacterized protein DUF6265
MLRTAGDRPVKGKQTAAPLLVIALTLSVVVIVGLAKVSTRARAEVAAPTLSELAWMSGAWETGTGGRVQVEEHWTRPAGGTMLGMSRTIAGGRTVEFEYLRLEQRATGIFYVAHPKARCPGTDFKLKRLSGQEAVFENPEHDFPKRIIYRKHSDGSLTAIVDGGEGTKSQSFVYFPVTR